jgi:hypothetical protein
VRPRLLEAELRRAAACVRRRSLVLHAGPGLQYSEFLGA